MTMIIEKVTPPIKDNISISNIREAATIAQNALRLTETVLLSGVRASYIDKKIEEYILSRSAYPANLEVPKFGFATCISSSDEIVHGIPTSKKILFSGDVVSVDIGVKYDGCYADCAKTFIVGGATVNSMNKLSYKMIYTCKTILEEAIKVLKPGVFLSEYGKKIEELISRTEYTVFKFLTGHSIGNSYHELPRVFNFYHKSNDIPLSENMVFALELMLTNGNGKYMKDNNGWTLKTSDGSIGVHTEHTVLITENGATILGVN